MSTITTPSQVEVFSLPELCVLLQRPPSEIRHALDELAIPPAWRVRGVDSWDSAIADKLFEHFRGKQ